MPSLPKSNFVTTDGYVPSYLHPTHIPVMPQSSTNINNNPSRLSGRGS
jgi:hypothetical protein